MPCAPCARAVSPSASPSPRRDTHHRRDSRGSQETQDEWTEDRRSANTLMLEALHPDAHRILIPRTTMYITHQIKSRCMRTTVHRVGSAPDGSRWTALTRPAATARVQATRHAAGGKRMLLTAACAPPLCPTVDHDRHLATTPRHHHSACRTAATLRPQKKRTVNAMSTQPKDTYGLNLVPARARTLLRGHVRAAWRMRARRSAPMTEAL